MELSPLFKRQQISMTASYSIALVLSILKYYQQFNLLNKIYLIENHFILSYNNGNKEQGKTSNIGPNEDIKNRPEIIF